MANQDVDAHWRVSLDGPQYLTDTMIDKKSLYCNRDAPIRDTDMMEHDFGQTVWSVPARYQCLSFFGNSSMGEVCSAMDRRSGEAIVIERVIAPFSDLNCARKTYKELTKLAFLSHPNITKLVDVFTSSLIGYGMKDYYFVTECAMTDLASVMEQCRVEESMFTEKLLRLTALQLFRALKYLQECGMMHEHIDPYHVQVDSNLTVKLSMLAAPTSNRMNYKEFYRAPEVVFGHKHVDDKADVWSVACILAELVIDRPMFHTTTAMDMIPYIYFFLGKPDQNFIYNIPSLEVQYKFNNPVNVRVYPLEFFMPHASPEYVNLLTQLLQVSSNKRLNAANALKHDFFLNCRQFSDLVPGQMLELRRKPIHEMNLDDIKSIATALLKTFPRRLKPNEQVLFHNL